MRIIIPGADFSSRNLGNINYFAGALAKMGVPAGPTYEAFKTFLNAFEAAGFREKFQRAYLFGGGTAQSDSVDIVTLLDANKLLFTNDSAGVHTVDGMQFSDAAGSVVATTPFTFTSLANFHLHSFINVAEPSANSIPCLCGVRSVAGGNDYAAFISWKGADWKPFAVIGPGIAQTVAKEGVAVATNTFGLLSGYRTANNVRLARNGAKTAEYLNVVDNTLIPAPHLNYFAVGGFGSAQTVSNNKSAARQRFCGFGTSAWTIDDEVLLNNMLTALEAAI